MSKPNLNAARGMTLVEMMVTTAIVAVIIGMLYPALMSGEHFIYDGTLQSELDAKAALIADEIATAVTSAYENSLTNNQTSSITFQQVLGYDPALSATPTLYGVQVGANLEGDDGSGIVARKAYQIPNAFVQYRYQRIPDVPGGKHCIVAYTILNNVETMHHILTEELTPQYPQPPTPPVALAIPLGFRVAPINSNAQSAGVTISVTIQRINRNLFMQDPNPEHQIQYTVYGRAEVSAKCLNWNP